jgi:hypothetical protein
MDRRNFLGSSRMALLAGFLAEVGLELPSALASDATNEETDYRLGAPSFSKLADPEKVKKSYEVGAKDVGASAIPYVYAFYDDKANKFLNPYLEVKPVLEKNSYTMQPILQSFNIRVSDQVKFKTLRNQIQLGFNASAPITSSDQLSWIFMNAVDIFLAKDDAGRLDQLTKFKSAAGTGMALNSNPKISISKGLVSLQVTAFGQKEEGFWTKFFSFLSLAADSPIASAASKGFGIPGLVPEAVHFVDTVLTVISEQNRLVELWKTGSLEFAVTKDAEARFNMRPGLWATIDTEYVQKTNFLEGHTVDLRYESFRIVDKDKKAIDANYLIADMKFAS